MKTLVVVLLVLAVGAQAGRPGALQVIDTFKQTIPKFVEQMSQNEEQLLAIEHEGTDTIVAFHNDIMLAKETFILSITNQEDELNTLLATQNQSAVDPLCTQFIATAANENVNLIGVAYTTCITAADDSLNSTAWSYYDSIGKLEQSVLDMHLLDVFRGDNVFYTPDNILGKLKQKLDYLGGGSTTNAPAVQQEIEMLQNDLSNVRGVYIECMTSAEGYFREYFALALQQLEAICGGTSQAVTQPSGITYTPPI